MRTEIFLKNKITRQIKWNGQPFEFIRYGINDYQEIDYNKIEEIFSISGIFHDGGGYGGMLNIELFERDGARTLTKMKPMILCLYDETSKQIQMDDVVAISDYKYKVVEKNNIKNLDIAYEISLELMDDECRQC